MAASSRSASFAYTAATALPEPHSRTQLGWVPASRSYSARSGGCFPKTGISKSLPPSRPMLPHPVNASASSSSGPRAAGSGCMSSHQPYASGVATASGGSARAMSAGAAGGAGSRNSRSPRPHASAAGAPLAKKATSAPSRVAKSGSSHREILLRRPEVGSIHPYRNFAGGRAGHHQLIRQLEEGECRLDLVIPSRGFARENAHQKI